MSFNALHINQSDMLGGAAIAAYRLHCGLVQQGIASHILAGVVRTNSPSVAAIPSPSLVEKQCSFLTRSMGLNYIHLTSTWKILRHPFYQAADILNFHNLHTDYFNYLAIPSLSRDKPAVLTLHDMWSFTGHCAYSYDCAKWRTGCGKCLYPHEHPPIRRDATHIEWRLKHEVYKRANLKIVAPSRWLVEQAKQSILNRFPISHIPYGIDTGIYKALNREQCRDVLGIPRHAKILMFVAHNLNDSRKGSDLLLQALRHVPQSLQSEMLLLVIGYGGEALAGSVNIPILNLGYIGSDHLKAIVYSAADLFVFPTRADNLPVVLQESMACGTPMVSFDVGGVSELVRSGETGYLAAPFDTQDFCRGILQLLEDKNLREQISCQCRNIAINEYRLELQAKRYIELYQTMLPNNRG